jgi:type IV pilus assembly protein PilW
MMNIKKQEGLSLIELMISSTLSLILMAAVLQVFVSTNITYNLTNDVGRIQENGRFSLDYLTNSLRLAHYKVPAENGPFLDTACGDFDPCTANGVGDDSDRVAVLFNPPADDGTETDCTGALVPADSIIANVFYITANGTINSLTCRGYDFTLGAWIAAEQPLIDGIDNMQVLYGINSSITSVNVTKYVNAANIPAADWPNVASVRIGLLVSSGDDIGTAESRTRKFILLDSDEISITDKKSRQIYSTTIAINNTTVE